MKIDVKLTGAACSVVDFPALRAALMAAQAGTPTARAARQRSPHDAGSQPSDLFGGAGIDFADGAVRNHHRFTAHVPEDEA